MPSNRITRVNELLKREIAGAIYRVVDSSEVDLATVTINRVETAPNLRKARVYLSVRGTVEEGRRGLSVMRRHRKEFQDAVSHHVVLKYTPQLHFILDNSVAEGDRVLEILSKIAPLNEDPDEDIDYDEYDGDEEEET